MLVELNAMQISDNINRKQLIAHAVFNSMHMSNNMRRKEWITYADISILLNIMFVHRWEDFS